MRVPVITHALQFHGRLYTPQCAGPPAPASDCKGDAGSMDWFEAGRMRAGTMLWTEGKSAAEMLCPSCVFCPHCCFADCCRCVHHSDWFGDSKASEWTYLAARLRCAAKLGGPDIQFGGYIVPRGPTGGVAHGTVGLLKKAISMVGSGASGIDWFEFGPEDTFPVRVSVV